MTGDQLAVIPDRFMWLSNETAFGDDDLGPRVTFDLGAKYLISKIRVWNDHEVMNGLIGRLVNIDGKTLRGSRKTDESTVQIVSAWAQHNGLPLAQQAVDKKSNEWSGTT